MNFIKTVFKWLLGLSVLAALLLGLALVPDFQTWVAQSMLARHPELHATIGSLSVGFGNIEAEDVRVEIGGALFTLPAVTAKLPVIECARKRSIFLRSLVAKDWTVELNPPPEAPVTTSESTAKADDASDAAAPTPTPIPEPTPPPAKSVRSVQQTLRAFSGFLTGWRLPFDFSADGIDIEGDLLVPGSGKERTRVHLAVQGGGIGVGREGSLSIHSNETFVGAEIFDLTWRGDLRIAMDTPQTIARVAVKGALSASETSSTPAFTLGTDFAVSRDVSAENYSVDLARDERHLLKLDARFETVKPRLTGTWTLNGRNGDLGPLVDDRAVPALSVLGTGNLTAEKGFTQWDASGELRILGDIWKAWGIDWTAPSSVMTTTRFNLAVNDDELKIDHWEIALAGPEPVVQAQVLQPVIVDLKTHSVQVKSPQADLVNLSLQQFPLEWLSGLTRGLSLGGNATGDFRLKATGQNIEVTSPQPLIAKKLFFQRNGQTVAQNLDLSVMLQAEKLDQVWQLHAFPASLSRDGRVLATIEANAVKPLTEVQPLEIKGKWSSDLASLLASPGNQTTEKKAPPLSGEFSASLGEETKIESSFNFPMLHAGESMRVKISAEIGSDRAIAFHVPLELATGKTTQLLSIDGNWAQNELGNEISINLSSKNIDREHLRLLTELAAWFPGFRFQSQPGNSAAGLSLSPQSGQLPFWGDVIGNVAVSFDHFGQTSSDLEDVHGNFRFNRDSIRLMSGQYRRGQQFCVASGTVAFEPAAEFPYRLQASFDDGEIDATPLFGTPPPDADPLFYGHFSVSSVLTGYGLDLDDLLRRSQQETKLKSKGGICRLLKTDVGNAMPAQAEHKVGEAASTVGSLVGKLAGIDQRNGGQIHVGKTTDAVLNFSYDVAEIGYDEISITVIRKFEGPWQLKEFSLLAPDEHITATGEIMGTGDASITRQPLQVDLNFGFRGKAAERLKIAGLLSTDKDLLGYTRMKQPIHIGGTLQRLDLSQWHDLLAEAAFPKPAKEK